MEDIGFLRNMASFEVKLSKDLMWVPVNSLGKGRYTNSKIKEIILLSPSDRKKYFSNLYEVLQSFLLCKFNYVMDTEYQNVDGLIWEIHKKKDEIVNNNLGCCYAVASWIKYYIDEIYEESGFFSFVRPNGTGHVMNYIRNNGWYYVIDLTPYVQNEKCSSFYESGHKLDYLKSRNVTGILMKCKELKSYALYYDRLQAVGGYHFIYFKVKEGDMTPISIKCDNNKITIIYPTGTDVECVYNGDQTLYSLEWMDINNNWGEGCIYV